MSGFRGGGFGAEPGRFEVAGSRRVNWEPDDLAATTGKTASTPRSDSGDPALKPNDRCFSRPGRCKIKSPALTSRDRVLFDEQSRRNFGPVGEVVPRRPTGLKTEVDGQTARCAWPGWLGLRAPPFRLRRQPDHQREPFLRLRAGTRREHRGGPDRVTPGG